MHTIIKAKVEALLECDDIRRLILYDDHSLCKSRDFLGKEVVILGAWPLESEFDNSALILVEDNFNTKQDFVIARGNAADQALYLHERKLTPVVRTLTAIEVNGHDLFYWRTAK